VRNVLVAPARRGFAYDAVADARSGIEEMLARSSAYADRANSTVLVTTVINRIGPDAPR
jgi:hypothetical protein